VQVPFFALHIFLCSHDAVDGQECNFTVFVKKSMSIVWNFLLLPTFLPVKGFFQLNTFKDRAPLQFKIQRGSKSHLTFSLTTRIWRTTITQDVKHFHADYRIVS